MRRLFSAYGLYVYPAAWDFRGGLGLAVTPGSGTEEGSSRLSSFSPCSSHFFFLNISSKGGTEEGEGKIIHCVFSCCKVNICGRRCFFFK